MEMTAEAREERRNYKRQYRSRNRDRINARQRAWNAMNQDKLKEYQKKYWEKKAETKNIRLPWSAYGITKERYKELLEIVRSGQYEAEVLSAAAKADKQAAEHIILSVTKNMSYESLQARWELREMERCPLGRTDFYGARRLFFHYLNCALKELPREKQ